MAVVWLPWAQESCKKLMWSDATECRQARKVLGTFAVTLALGKGAFDMYWKIRLWLNRQEKFLNCKLAKEKLRKELDELNLDSDAILKLSTDELSKKLKSGELKAEDVLRVYQYKALLVDDEVNCIIEPFTEALTMAQELDKKGSGVGLLYGIPISLKDNIVIKGYDSTLGIAKNINHPFPEDSVIVKVLKMQGAIPYVKTNVPQTLLSIQCSNPIFGQTVNPYNKSRISGGSSGGEAALIASGGSILGVGSDIGGSLRIPAHMCGVCSLKPTGSRISGKGLHPKSKEFQQVGSVCGPISRDVEGTVLFMKACLTPMMYQLDSTVVPLPFDEETYKSTRPLRIGYYTYDGFLHATPPCVRAVEEVKAILERQGHTLTPWTPPDVSVMMLDLYASFISGDGGKTLFDQLKGDKVDSCMTLLYYLIKTPAKVRKVLSLLSWPFSKNLSIILKAGIKEETVHDWWKLCTKHKNYVEEVLDHWRNNNLDAVICPGFTNPAPPQGGTLQPTVCYTALYNIIDLPAGSVPVTRVTEQDDQMLETDYPTPDFLHKIVKRFSGNSVGLPISVQVAAPKWKEEVCLRIMKEIEGKVNYS